MTDAGQRTGPNCGCSCVKHNRPIKVSGGADIHVRGANLLNQDMLRASHKAQKASASSKT